MTHALLSLLVLSLPVLGWLAVPLPAADLSSDAKLADVCRSAEKLMVTGKGEEARALLAKAGGAQPDVRLVVLTARSYLCWRPTDADAAKRVLKSFLDQPANRNNAEALLEWAHMLRESHDYRNALATYDRIIRITPRELRAYYGKVDVALAQEKFKDAEVAARAALDIDASQPESHFYMGKVQERRTDKPGARQTSVSYFQRAAELAGANTRYYGPLLFAQMMYAAGDYAGTLARLKKTAPGDASVAFGEGLLLDSQGKLPEAIAKFQGAIAVDPAHTYAHFALGTLWTGHSLTSIFRGTSSRSDRRAAIANPTGTYTEYATVRLQDPTFPYMSVIDDFSGRMQASESPGMSPELQEQQKAWQKYWLLLQLRH